MALLVGALLAFGAGELVARTLVVDGRFRERPVPPFARLSDAKRAEWLALLEDPDAFVVGGVFNAYDRGLGWTNRPGRTERFGEPVTIGALGERGGCGYAPTPPAGVLRVACYGESFTFGSEVGDADSWPARLEALDASLEAVNLGVGGYGTDQALLRFRRRGTLGARAVVVNVMVENVARNVNRRRQLFAPSADAFVVKPRFVLEPEGLRLVPLPFETRREVVRAACEGTLDALLAEHEYFADEGPWLASRLVALFAQRPALARRDVTAIWRDTGGEPFRTTLAVVEAFRAEVEASGASFLVLVFPRKRDLAELRDGGQRPWRTLLEALDARGIEHLDVSDRLLASGGRALYRGDHLSPRGNALTAWAVHEWLVARFPGHAFEATPSEPRAR